MIEAYFQVQVKGVNSKYLVVKGVDPLSDAIYDEVQTWGVELHHAPDRDADKKGYLEWHFYHGSRATPLWYNGGYCRVSTLLRYAAMIAEEGGPPDAVDRIKAAMIRAWPEHIVESWRAKRSFILLSAKLSGSDCAPVGDAATRLGERRLAAAVADGFPADEDAARAYGRTPESMPAELVA